MTRLIALEAVQHRAVRLHLQHGMQSFQRLLIELLNSRMPRFGSAGRRQSFDLTPKLLAHDQSDMQSKKRISSRPLPGPVP